MPLRRARLLAACACVLLLAAACGGGQAGTRTPSGPVPSSAATAGPTRFGAAVYPEAGESYEQALAREDATFGGMQIVRVFYSGAPEPWPGRAGAANRPVVVSFKLAPRAVLAGRYDDAMRRWFATAPRSYPVYWSFYHEPEDNIRRGEFTAADYRAAWRHLAALADAAHNPQLRATLILMNYTLFPQAHRSLRDYYPGGATIDVLGWDVYSEAFRNGGYASPSSLFDDVARASAQLHKPWGVAELGSQLAAGDTGSGRAAWLRACGSWLTEHGAEFGLYFDTPVGGNFVLRDAPSQASWRSVVTGATQRRGAGSPAT